jgi:hypothetical protein
MKVLITVLASGGMLRAELAQWLVRTTHVGMRLPHVEDVQTVMIDQCPTPVARNQSVEHARRQHCDVLVSVDADTLPHDDFLASALDEVRKRPCVVGSPYVCAGDDMRVQIFRWSSREDVTGNEAMGRCVHVSRDEAARLSGAEEVAFFGTGCYAADVRAFEKIAPPYFGYEYEDARMLRVVSTEDVRCFRDLSLAGVPMVCLWDRWATHMKVVPLGRPLAYSPGDVAERSRRFLAGEASLPPLENVSHFPHDGVLKDVPAATPKGVGR